MTKMIKLIMYVRKRTPHFVLISLLIFLATTREKNYIKNTTRKTEAKAIKSIQSPSRLKVTGTIT
jgi:hypothetical protein